MFTAGSVAFAGLVCLGLFFWRLSRLLDRKVINPVYVENEQGGVSVITNKGISDVRTHDRRNLWATISLFIQQLMLMIPVAYVAGGLRYGSWVNWSQLDLKLIIPIAAFVSIILWKYRPSAIKKVREQSRQPRKRGTFTYSALLAEGSAAAGLAIGVIGVLTHIWILLPVAVLCTAVMIIHVWVRSRKGVKEFKEDHPEYYNR